jgi:mono/diheme cytochrome c family protein
MDRLGHCVGNRSGNPILATKERIGSFGDNAMRVFIISFLVGLAAAVSAVQAQDIGDLRKGRRFALDACAACHAVRSGQTQSPLDTAPSFQEIADTPGMTAAALNFWLTAQVHPAMPLLMLSSQQVRDVSAYILSLRTKP